MPVRFNCPVCSQLLGIGSRKIGNVIHCPKCQGEIIVPTQEQAVAAAVELDRFDQPDIEETLSSLVVYDQVSVSATGGISGGLLASGHKVTRPAADRSDEQRYVAISRSVLYLQGALFAIVALVFFVCGYWIAGAPAPRDNQPIDVDAKPATARLSVRLTYLDSKGVPQPDGDAVVLALPVGARPGDAMSTEAASSDALSSGRAGDEASPAEKLAIEKLAIDGLRPSDPAPNAADPLLMKLERQGIAYGRTNSAGELSGLIVTAGQKYQLLVLSKHAQRPRGSKPRPDDLKLLEAYFTDPAKLLGDRQYYLTVEEMDDSVKLVYEFAKSQK